MKQYEHALVIGKFMNPHVGHQALIEQAIDIAEKVTVLICESDSDVVDSNVRFSILRNTFGSKITLRKFDYALRGLEGGEGSDRDISAKWANYVDEYMPEIDVMVGSEDYVTYMAQVGQFESFIYDMERSLNPISSTEVRLGAFEHYMPEAKLQFAQRVYLTGPDSDLMESVYKALDITLLEYMPGSYSELKSEILTIESVNLDLIMHSSDRLVYLPSLIDYTLKIKTLYGNNYPLFAKVSDENRDNIAVKPLNIIIIPEHYPDYRYVSEIQGLLPKSRTNFWIRSEDDIPALLKKIEELKNV